MNNNNDMRTEDGFSVKWKVSMNTELDMKTRKNSGNDSDIKRNSSMVMLELHALSVIVCALIVAAAPGGDGWSGRGGARRNRCGKREKLRHHDVYACAGWRIVVGCWSCCALTSRPRVCLPGGKRLVLPLRCGRAAVYSCFLHGISLFSLDFSGFVIVGAGMVQICYVLDLFSSPGCCWRGMSLGWQEAPGEDTAGGKQHYEFLWTPRGCFQCTSTSCRCNVSMCYYVRVVVAVCVSAWTAPSLAGVTQEGCCHSGNN